MSITQPSWQTNLSVFALGFSLKKSFDYLFDYVLYPAALFYLGYAWGGVVMTIASLVVSVLFIRAYDWLRCDFLLLEQLKDLQDRMTGHATASLLARAMRASRPLAFMVLSWIEDPAIVTLYFRKGSRRYNGMSGTDWVTFAAATLVANLLWIGSVGVVLEALATLLP